MDRNGVCAPSCLLLGSGNIDCAGALMPGALSSPECRCHLLHVCGRRGPEARQDAVPIHFNRREHPGHRARVHGPCGPWSQAGGPQPIHYSLV